MKPGLVAVLLGVWLFSRSVYGQELSDRERKIYYDAAWEGLQADYQLGMNPSVVENEEYGRAMTDRLLTQNGITQEQLEDIMERGRQMPFTTAEEELAQEMDRKITDELTPDEIMAALNNFANKYGMSIGQVSSIFLRKLARD